MLMSRRQEHPNGPDEGDVGAIDYGGDGYSSIRRFGSDDIDMFDAEPDPTPTNTSSASNVANEMPSYAEDVQVVYMEVEFPCDIRVLQHGSGFLRKALEGFDDIEPKMTSPTLPSLKVVAYPLSRQKYRLVGVPRFIECESHDIFYAVL